MGIDEVYNVIHGISEGFESSVADCMDAHQDIITDCITEQLYSGVDGKGKYLNPTYDNDPYFNEDGPWKNKGAKYKEWKNRITPPVSSYYLNLPPRPVEVPNLFITGTFYSSIKTARKGNAIDVYTEGFRDGPTIEKKYGENIFTLGSTAKDYFIRNYLMPWIEKYFNEKGYVV